MGQSLPLNRRGHRRGVARAPSDGRRSWRGLTRQGRETAEVGNRHRVALEDRGELHAGGNLVAIALDVDRHTGELEITM